MRRDSRSPEAEAYRAWYKTYRWQKLRARQLAEHPLCRFCQNEGHITPATVCDHTEPHKGDEPKFWSGPFTSLCKLHHDSTKQSMEKGSKPRIITRVGVDGWPQ